MNPEAKQILEQLMHDFQSEDGPEYYEYVHFYSSYFEPKHALLTDDFPVALDGEFTIRTLQKIIDGMKAAIEADNKIVKQ